MRTYDPDRMTERQRLAVADWLRKHGEERPVTLSPVRQIGPWAVYRVYALDHEGQIVIRDGDAVIAPAIAWVGCTRPEEG